MESTVDFALIKEKIIQTDDLFHIVQQKTEESKKLQEACVLLKNRCKAFKNDIYNLKLENERLSYNCNNAEDKLRKLEGVYDELKSAHDKLKAEYGTDINSLHLKYQSVNVEIEKYKLKCKCSLSTESELPRKRIRKSIEIGKPDWEKQCIKLNQKIEQLRSTHDAEVLNFKNQIKELQEQLDTSEESHRTEIEILISENDDLKRKNSDQYHPPVTAQLHGREDGQTSSRTEPIDEFNIISHEIGGPDYDAINRTHQNSNGLNGMKIIEQKMDISNTSSPDKKLFSNQHTYDDKLSQAELQKDEAMRKLALCFQIIKGDDLLVKLQNENMFLKKQLRLLQNNEVNKRNYLKHDRSVQTEHILNNMWSSEVAVKKVSDCSKQKRDTSSQTDEIYKDSMVDWNDDVGLESGYMDSEASSDGFDEDTVNVILEEMTSRPALLSDMDISSSDDDTQEMTAGIIPSSSLPIHTEQLNGMDSTLPSGESSVCSLRCDENSLKLEEKYSSIKQSNNTVLPLSKDSEIADLVPGITQNNANKLITTSLLSIQIEPLTSVSKHHINECETIEKADNSDEQGNVNLYTSNVVTSKSVKNTPQTNLGDTHSSDNLLKNPVSKSLSQEVSSSEKISFPPEDVDDLITEESCSNLPHDINYRKDYSKGENEADGITDEIQMEHENNPDGAITCKEIADPLTIQGRPETSELQLNVVESTELAENFDDLACQQDNSHSKHLSMNTEVENEDIQKISVNTDSELSNAKKGSNEEINAIPSPDSCEHMEEEEFVSGQVTSSTGENTIGRYNQNNFVKSSKTSTKTTKHISDNEKSDEDQINSEQSIKLPDKYINQTKILSSEDSDDIAMSPDGNMEPIGVDEKMQESNSEAYKKLPMPVSKNITDTQSEDSAMSPDGNAIFEEEMETVYAKDEAISGTVSKCSALDAGDNDDSSEAKLNKNHELPPAEFESDSQLDTCSTKLNCNQKEKSLNSAIYEALIENDLNISSTKSKSDTQSIEHAPDLIHEPKIVSPNLLDSKSIFNPLSEVDGSENKSGSQMILSTPHHEHQINPLLSPLSPVHSICSSPHHDHKISPLLSPISPNVSPKKELSAITQRHINSPKMKQAENGPVFTSAVQKKSYECNYSKSEISHVNKLCSGHLQIKPKKLSFRDNLGDAVVSKSPEKVPCKDRNVLEIETEKTEKQMEKYDLSGSADGLMRPSAYSNNINYSSSKIDRQASDGSGGSIGSLHGTLSSTCMDTIRSKIQLDTKDLEEAKDVSVIHSIEKTISPKKTSKIKKPKTNHNSGHSLTAAYSRIISRLKKVNSQTAHHANQLMNHNNEDDSNEIVQLKRKRIAHQEKKTAEQIVNRSNHIPCIPITPNCKNNSSTEINKRRRYRQVQNDPKSAEHSPNVSVDNSSSCIQTAPSQSPSSPSPAHNSRSTRCLRSRKALRSEVNETQNKFGNTDQVEDVNSSCDVISSILLARDVCNNNKPTHDLGMRRVSEIHQNSFHNSDSIDNVNMHCQVIPSSGPVENLVENELKRVPRKKLPEFSKKKLKLLFKKLINYSKEEKALEEVCDEFLSQEPLFVVQNILDKVSVDFIEKADNKYSPAPLMTETQRTMLGLMSRLESLSDNSYFDIYLSLAEKRLLFCPVLEQIEPITRLYLAICKLRRDISRMRRLCCEAFYFMNELAVPLFFTVLTSWSEVLPFANDCDDYLLGKVLAHIVQLKEFNIPGYNLLPLKELLIKFYGYPAQRWDSKEVFQEIFQEYLRNPVRLSDFTILLYCKNHPSKWVYNTIEQYFKPIVTQTPSENFKATVIILIGNIVSQFNLDSDQSYICDIESWFENLRENTTSDIVSRSINLSLSRLPHYKEDNS